MIYRKIKELEQELLESKEKLDETIEKIKADLVDKYNINSIKQIARRAICYYFGEYISYEWDKINRNLTLEHYKDNQFISINRSYGGFHENSENIGFICELKNIKHVYEIQRHMKELWLHNCNENHYKEGFNKFKSLSPSKILEVYSDWISSSCDDAAIEIINEKSLKLKDVVMVFYKTH